MQKSKIKMTEQSKKSENKMKALVLIDGANIFYTQQHLGWSVDWGRMMKQVGTNYEILESRYYTGIKDGDERMKKFLRYLREMGMKTMTKPLKTIKDAKGHIHYKSNCDVEMAIDAVLNVNTFDVLVLFSGDSDFVYLAKLLQRQFQKKVIVYSSRKTISWEIRMAANEHYFLEDMKAKINRRSPGGTVKQG